jgi:hypothetical protein
MLGIFSSFLNYVFFHKPVGGGGADDWVSTPHPPPPHGTHGRDQLYDYQT